MTFDLYPQRHAGFGGWGGGPDWKAALFLGVLGLLAVGGVLAVGLALGAGA